MKYITHWPTLANELKKKGYKLLRFKYPYYETRFSWVTDLDDKGVEYVKRKLAEAGKEMFFPTALELAAAEQMEKVKELTKRASTITARQIAEKVMPDQMQGNNCTCPRCGWYRGISFTDNGKFLCRNCGISGTGIGFVMLTGVTSEEAAEQICKEFGV